MISVLFSLGCRTVPAIRTLSPYFLRFLLHTMMPGLIVFRRRWSVGSDDLVVPGAFLFTVHLVCLIILILSIALLDYDRSKECIDFLWMYEIGYMSMLAVNMLIELAICVISMRGSILEAGPRAGIHYWLYIKVVMLLFDVSWLSLGIVWLVKFYVNCEPNKAKKIMLGLIICNWIIVLSILVTIWCTFDAAGRSWVKMKKYQRSMRESESRFNYKRSGSMNRNWRQRKVIRAYQDSWDHRCRLLFCCMGTSERNRNSFAEIAKLLSDFFRELDVVPSDVVAGLVLLRKFQKLKQHAIIRQCKNGTYEFLSGVPITARTQFLALNDTSDYEYFQTVIHYMHYALGAYGWPMFLMTRSKTGLCQLCTEVQCCWTCCRRNKQQAEVVDDNCCLCNYAALKRMVQIGEVEVIYTTFHVDVGETPFFVAIDYSKCKIVISIRGTLSMKDVLTDLNAEGDVLPLEPSRDDWLGHKGMIQAAVYIKYKLEEENLIQKALTHNMNRNTSNFDLVLVGHSLGAGTAAILAILLKPDYPSLQCFSYSPPGGLLSMPAVEYTKTFITSVVVGKDVVPRIGLYQMEALRADLINAIKRSVDPKWKTIACSMICCCCGPQPTSVVEMSSHDANVNVYEQQRTSARKTSAHPNDSSIALTLHRPLYPPGRIIHIVRHHPTNDEQKYEQGWRQVLKSHEPVYQAIWVDNTDFDEVLISPAMIQDHMPDTVLSALNKVITTYGPRKPQRNPSNATSILSEHIDGIEPNECEPSIDSLSNCPTTPSVSAKICLETSFTNLQQPCEPLLATSCCGNSSQASSLTGSVFGGRSQMSPSGPSDATTILLTDAPPNGGSRQGKCVAFDIRSNVRTPGTIPISPGVLPKSILHRQPPSILNKSTILPIASNVRPDSLTNRQKHGLMHDDWYGIAPLASPETLSEISSISSRTSLNLASSIEKYLHRIVQSVDDPKIGSYESLDSQMHTPRVMRRTPKITGNLSKCADDWQLVNKYKRMGKKLLANRVPSSNHSSENSYESATSEYTDKVEEYIPSDDRTKSVDQLDDRRATEPSYQMNEKMCASESAMDESNPIPNNENINRISLANTTSSSDTYHSVGSTDHHEQTIINQMGIIESHFPVYFDTTIDRLPSTDKSKLLENDDNRTIRTNRSNSTNKLCQRKQYGNDRYFKRNESLPLLANLTERSGTQSPPTQSFIKRKKYVYPMPVRQPPTNKGSESSV